MNFLNKIKQQASKVAQKWNPKIQVVQMGDRIYHCPYPTDPSMFKQIIKQLNANKVKIYNLSEYPYSKQLKQKIAEYGIEICELTYQFYSSMPLTVSIGEVLKIENYLKKERHSYVLVHCQQNKSRSIVFLAIYFYLSGKYADVASSLAQVNRRLSVQNNQTVYSSQHMILKNVANYHQNPAFITKQQLKLIKIVINQAPILKQINLSEEQPLSLFIQVRRNGVTICKKITKQFGQGQIAQFNFKDDNVILSDDCLISFKYIFKDKAYPVARIQINTNFIFNNFLRVQMQQMDICKNAITKGHIFTDLIVQAIPDTFSQLSKIGKKQNNLDIQKHYETNANKTNLNQLISKSKKQKKQLAMKVQQQEEKEKVQQQHKQQKHEDAFNINDELGQNIEDQGGKITQQQIDQMLINIAMKKQQVTEQIKEQEEEYEDQQQEQQKQTNKNSQAPIIANQSEAKTQQTQIRVQSQNIQKSKEKQEQNEQKEKQKTQKTAQSQQKQKKQTKQTKQKEQEIDIDDYLSKLEEQADEG